jgi:hypothetical protein
MTEKSRVSSSAYVVNLTMRVFDKKRMGMGTIMKGTYQRRGEVRDILDLIRGSVYAIKITPEANTVTNQRKI